MHVKYLSQQQQQNASETDSGIGLRSAFGTLFRLWWVMSSCIRTTNLFNFNQIILAADRPELRNCIADWKRWPRYSCEKKNRDRWWTWFSEKRLMNTHFLFQIPCAFFFFFRPIHLEIYFAWSLLLLINFVSILKRDWILLNWTEFYTPHTYENI